MAPVRWYVGRPAIRAEVACGGARHHVAWRRGRLVAEDHDVAAERALGAIGALPPSCLEVLNAWRVCFLDEAAVLTSDWADQIIRYHSSRFRAEERIPAALRESLLVATALRASRGWHDPAVRATHAEALEKEATALAAEPFRQWTSRPLADLGVDGPVRLECRICEPGEEPLLRGWVDCTGASASARLPLRWIVDAGSRGAATVVGPDGFLLDDRADGRVVAVWSREDDGLWSASVRRLPR